MSQGCSIYTQSLYEINAQNLGDFIRLVRPVKNTWGETFELKTFALGNAPPYAALSYSWGTKSQTAAVVLDNGIIRQSLAITADLEDALNNVRVQRVRYRPDCAKWSGWLWVDQICINQADELEKGHQVSRMKEIYGNAECVFVWLGRNVIDQGCRDACYGDPPCRLYCRKVVDLLNQGLNCWWNRLWVIQEISSCQHLFVWIGEVAFEWDLFWQGFCDRMDRLTSDLIAAHSPGDLRSTPMDYEAAMREAEGQMRSLQRLRKTLMAQEDGEDLLELLRSTLPSGVSNELDRVYSLLGLATADYRDNVPVMYGVSLGVVFSSVIQHVIRRSENLDVLFDKWPRGPDLSASRPRLATAVTRGMLHLSTANRNERTPPLPTWMPDFSRPTRYIESVTKSRYAAGTFAKARVSVTERLELCLTSIVLGTVESITRSIPCYPSGRFDYDLRKHNDLCRKGFSDLSMMSIERQSTAQQNPGFNLARFWRNFDMFDVYTMCLKTAQGYFGFASVVRVGDEVIVPLGASAPFVVRSTSVDSRRQVCELVGDCYVEGIMNGELKAMLERGQVQTKEYRIQ